MNLEQFCKLLPKVELHAHLNGSLSKETLTALGVPQHSLKCYQMKSYISENPNVELNKCFRLFKVAHAATNTVSAVYTATKHVIEEFNKDNVIYLELRTTPRQELGMTKVEYVEAIVRAIRDNQSSITVKLILSIDRTHSLQVSNEALDFIVQLHQQHPDVILGVDLCGNPNEGNFYEKLFTKARNNGLKVTLHCAEVKNDVEAARILKFKPDRIGHATCIHPNYGGSQELWELYQSLPIPAECCLTSNVMSGTSKSYSAHHVQEWLNNKLPFSVNTDDKGVFNTTSSEEYFHVAKTLNLRRSTLLDCILSSIKSAFVSHNVKEVLTNYVLRWKNENSHLLLEELVTH